MASLRRTFTGWSWYTRGYGYLTGLPPIYVPLSLSFSLYLSSAVLSSLHQRLLPTVQTVQNTVKIPALVCELMVAFLLVFTVLRTAVNSDSVYSSIACLAIGLAVCAFQSALLVCSSVWGVPAFQIQEQIENCRADC